MDALTKKLLAYALDPSATDAEADNAAARMIRHLRKNGVKVDDFASGQSVRVEYRTEEVRTVVTRFPNRDMCMPFGKHKGKTLGWIFANAPGYIEWLHENIEHHGLLSRAVKQIMEDRANE